MRKRILAVLAAFVVAAGVTIAIQTPASASIPSSCSVWSVWVGSGGSGWGQMRWCTATDAGGLTYARVEVDDTLTDGYQVHAEFQGKGGSGFDEIGNSTACQYTQSSGTPTYSCWDSTTWSFISGAGDPLDIRLVRGRACCPHENVAVWSTGWKRIIF